MSFAQSKRPPATGACGRRRYSDATGDDMKVTRDMIDPQLRFRGTVSGALLPARTVEYMRKTGGKKSLLEKLAMKPRTPAGCSVEEEWIPRGDGSRMRTLVYTPIDKPAQNVTGLLCLHGGGFYTGSPEAEIDFLVDIIDFSSCVVVAPEFRLSIDAPYPAPLDDCYTTLLWLRDNACRLGVRDDQIAVAGMSGGGGLTAATTLYARDNCEVNIAFQMPIFPMIDDRNDTESARDNDDPIWDLTANTSGWKIYLGDLYGTDDVPAYAAPARATEYSGLPPTYTYVGSLEPFRDETITYVENLRAAGVPVDFEVYAGCYHGFPVVAPRADVSIRAVESQRRWFQAAVQEYFAPQPG